MGKINIHITAHVANETYSMTIFRGNFERHEVLDFFENRNAFHDWLFKNFPLVSWEYDDGDDKYWTGYAQYVAYTDLDKRNYLLATLEEVEQ